MFNNQNDYKRITLEDGKYSIYYNHGTLKAERYREPWRDLTGDKLVGAMFDEIVRLREILDTTYRR